MHPYDPQWPENFRAERELLLSLFPTQLLDVQHFGSTAVPGMPAKPIIDLLGGVASMAGADALGGRAARTRMQQWREAAKTIRAA